ncbi:adenylate/guanylate cyclase domain-containing protein [Nitrosomonas marina]|uniref:Adenylate cyclase n=1 Tax=Nitrosomonas marina TaxID=917 RepID=A0A1H8G5M0_9PROT|nr:adenylate/guanylate cyclase domain-containing protein [Nitrosomonas marina]SEN39054.1 adenylate cyclase [Nitrosomonas marina]
MTKYAKRAYLGITIGLLGMALYLSPQGWYLEEKYGLGWLFQLRGPVSAPEEIIIIAIDRESTNQLGLPVSPNFWPWPREIHARLIDQLAQFDAEIIVLDLLFLASSAVTEHDHQLAKTIENAGNVIIVERLEFEQQDFSDSQTESLQFKLFKERSAPLLPEISSSVMAHAPFPLPKEPPINAYWAFKPGMGDAPTIPVVVLQAYALHAYNELFALLDKVQVPGIKRLPASLDQIKDIEAVIFFLRELFIDQPEIKQQLISELHASNLDYQKRKLILSLVNLYTGPEAHYLNFYGPPRNIETIPAYQILQPNEESINVLPNKIRGKVVFVGLSAATHIETDQIRDTYHTVFTDAEGIEISGVEIAATAFANLLENKPVSAFPYAGSLVLIFTMGLTLGFVFPVLSNQTLSAASIITAVAYTAVAWLMFKQAGIWLPLIIPLLIIIPGTIFGSVLLNYYTAKQERDQLLELFGQFTPERVVGDLTRHINANLRKDQLVFGACMFTDIQGYTTLAEKMDVRELRRLIDDYFRILSRSVRENNGVVSEKIGDAMLAIWEATTASKMLREEACEAGLAIIKNLDSFNRESSHPALPTRIGIHFGKLLVSKLGSMDNYIYRVIGDLVNTTSRIENANKFLGTRLLVTGEVIAGIDRFLTRPLGSFQLAGRSKPVCLFELIDYQQTASDKQRLLCTLFANALDAYSQQHENAVRQWTEILKLFPDDGATKFYLGLCAQSSPDQWEPVIKFTKK